MLTAAGKAGTPFRLEAYVTEDGQARLVAVTILAHENTKSWPGCRAGPD